MHARNTAYIDQYSETESTVVTLCDSSNAQLLAVFAAENLYSEPLKFWCSGLQEEKSIGRVKVIILRNLFFTMKLVTRHCFPLEHLIIDNFDHQHASS